MGTLYACKPVIHTMLMLSDAKQLDRAWIQQEQAVLGIDVTTMSKLSVRGRTHLFVLGEPSIRPQAVWGFSNKYKFEKEDGVKKALGILEKKSTPKNMMQIIAINQFKNVTNRSDLPFALYSTLAAALKTSIEECPQILLRECGSVPYCEMEGFRNPSHSFPYHWSSKVHALCNPLKKS
ncbi:hypothetical protein AB1Y20_012182 [Prymnesium parvum]|uniref:Uncharacterized protein n=1 Tax=Prymnesium parvum TaxID=97485 RepID=A0AB34IQI7_PRYPA